MVEEKMINNLFMSNDLAVKKAWGSYADNIKQWWFIDSTPQDIRYVMRDWNKIILQKAVLVEVEFNKEILINENFYITDKKLVWIDVPIISQM